MAGLVSAIRSLNQWRVQNAAGVPQLIEPARNPELGTFADIAIVHFAVIADTTDDARRPVAAQPQLLAIAALGADKPHHFRLRRFERFIDVLRIDPKLL